MCVPGGVELVEPGLAGSVRPGFERIASFAQRVDQRGNLVPPAFAHQVELAFDRTDRADPAPGLGLDRGNQQGALRRDINRTGADLRTAFGVGFDQVALGFGIEQSGMAGRRDLHRIGRS